jgi:hypothetical protein
LKKLITILVALLMAVTLNPVVATAVKTDPKKQEIWNLTQCKTKTELDCVESAAIWVKGKKVVGRQVSIQRTSFKTDLGNRVSGGLGIWSFPGVPGTSRLEARLESPRQVGWIEPDGRKIRLSSLRVYFLDGVVRRDYQIEVSVRTSWMKPMDVQLHTDDSTWSRKAIKGGDRWSVKGKPSKISGYSEINWQKKINSGAKADWDDVRWGFLVHHAAPFGEGGYFGDRCAESGFSAEAHNAPGAGQPWWDEEAETLFFNIQAAVKDTRGRPVSGKFKLWMDTKYVQCMWPGSTLGMAKTLSVSVVNKDGEEQAVNSWSLVDTGMFRIEVNGFSYGDTTIRIKPLRIARVCEAADGTTQEVVGIDPQCPEGTTLVNG